MTINSSFASAWSSTIYLCSSCQAVSNSSSPEAISVEKKRGLQKHVTNRVVKRTKEAECRDTVLSRFILCDNCATA